MTSPAGSTTCPLTHAKDSTCSSVLRMVPAQKVDRRGDKLPDGFLDSSKEILTPLYVREPAIAFKNLSGFKCLAGPMLAEWPSPSKTVDLSPGLRASEASETSTDGVHRRWTRWT